MKNKNHVAVTLAVAAAMFICAGTMAMATEIRIVKVGGGPVYIPGTQCVKAKGGPGPACIPGDPCGTR